MAEDYRDEEQVEAIKNWWKENGVSVLTGIILGLALLFGWRAWQSYSQQEAENASALYEQTLAFLEGHNLEKAKETANTLLTQYTGSPYAALAALSWARQDLEDEQIDSSLARLQWVIDQNSLPELTHIARLRKIRLLLVQQQFDKAKAEIEKVEMGEFKGAYFELKGDIAMAQGQKEAARTAYKEAVESKDLTGSHQKLVALKLEDLGELLSAAITAPSLQESALGNPTTAAAAANTTIPIEQESALGNPKTAAVNSIPVKQVTTTPVKSDKNSTAEVPPNSLPITTIPQPLENSVRP